MSFNLSLQVSKNVSIAPCVDWPNIITVCHLSDVCSTRQLIVSEVGSEALTMGMLWKAGHTWVVEESETSFGISTKLHHQCCYSVLESYSNKTAMNI